MKINNFVLYCSVPLTIAVIQEVYNGKDALEKFEQDFERALEDSYQVIIIEPNRLGDETATWIAVGDCLHRTAYLAGIGSLAGAITWTDKPYICTPLCILSLFCTGIYTLAWHFDPCVHYKVVRKVEKLYPKYPDLKKFNLADSSCVILVRRDNTHRSLLHSGVSLLAAAVCAWRLYDAFK